MIETWWPAWRPEWVIHESSDLLVVDKPADMPTQPMHEVGDVVARLRRFRPDAYIGLLHPLDRLMSGLVLVSKNRTRNTALAAELAQGVARSYLAVVAKPPARVRGFATEVLGRKGSRALVRLSSNAPSQPVRRALAAAGAPAAGDVENGGEPAPRLMVHHERMRVGGSSFEAPAPELFAWLEQRPLPQPLQAAIDRRYGIAQRGDTNAFRLVNGAGDALPGIEIDLYDDYAVVFVPEEAPAVDGVLDDLVRLGLRGVYLKRRPKKASDADTRALAPAAPVRGDAAPDPLVVVEAGLRYHVRLGEGLATGIFLDQRHNRELVRSISENKRVLNLFGYTGAFSVAAAAGGAAAVVTVDSSKTALARAEENLALNGAVTHSAAHGDALRWLERQKTPFEVIILDPPSFSTTATSTFRAERDYRSLASLALRCLARGGTLLACTNHRGIGARELKKMLAASARDAGRGISEMRVLPDPVDFPAPPGQSCHLKSVLLVSAS